MKRPDGAWMTKEEMEETISNLRVQLDNANERIMKYEAMFTPVVVDSGWEPDMTEDEIAERLPV